jgi:hypothetical protein
MMQVVDRIKKYLEPVKPGDDDRGTSEEQRFRSKRVLERIEGGEDKDTLPYWDGWAWFMMEELTRFAFKLRGR